MTSSKALNVGIIGAGGIARHLHLPSFHRCENVSVVAVVDISEDALEQVKAEWNIENLYRDYRQMLEMDDLDIVSICTSNDMHHPVAMAAMERGLDVYCEKPLALNLAQASEMYRSAQAKGIKTGVNFCHRRTPAAQLAKEIIDSGAVGNIHYVSAVYAAGGTNYAERAGTWRNDRTRAGYGGLGDMGAHMIDMMRWWLGCDITSVAAQTQIIVPERVARGSRKPMKVTTEDHGTLLLSYANGAMGYLCGSYVFTGRGYDQRAEVYGSQGGLMYDQQRPLELEVCLPPECLERYEVLRLGGTRDTPYATILVPERLRGLVPGEPGKPRGPRARRTLIMDYVEALRAEGPFDFSPGFHEGLKVQEVLEASSLAEEGRCWVDLPL